jgi:hypothetical protein
LDETNSAGSGDVSWAFEWDASLNASSSSLISKDIDVLIPEPSTWLLVGVAATLFGFSCFHAPH